MNDSVCERASLVEATLDERLGPTERASMDRHLKACASCAELLRDLLEIRETLRGSVNDVAPLEHQRARLALLRAAAAPAPRKRPIALLVAAAVMIPFAVWAAAATVGSWRTPDREQGAPPASSSVIAPPAALPAPTTTTATTAAPEPAPEPTTAPSTPIPTPTVSAPAFASARPHASAVSSAPAPAAPSSSTSHASQDFAKAMDSIARGDFGAGARELDQFASSYPSDPRVEEALYLQAIALERAGRLAEAKTAARRYLAAYPSGAHRTQAQRLAGE